MAINFTIPEKLKAKNIKTLQEGFGLAIKTSLTPTIPDYPMGDFPDGITKYGTYYYDSLFIEAPFWSVSTYNQESGEFVETSSGIMYSPDFIPTNEGNISGVMIKGCVVNVTSTNNVVKTEIAGQNGTVKEYINQGDYGINIKGFFDETLPDKYPFTRTNLLNYYCSSPVPLKITNDFLNSVFKIKQIVVENINIYQQQGMRNIQYFEINAVSDIDYIIEEKS